MSDSNEWEHGHELEDDIAPLRGPSRMATGNFEDDVDTEWLRFNILSIGIQIRILQLNLC